MEIPCCGFTCPVEATLRLVGGKYKAVILWPLMDAGTLRYHELHRRIPRATDKMLAQQLRELERDGLLRRAVYPVVPPKTEYSLTDFGRSLAPILDEMCRWGEVSGPEQLRFLFTILKKGPPPPEVPAAEGPFRALSDYAISPARERSM